MLAHIVHLLLPLPAPLELLSGEAGNTGVGHWLNFSDLALKRTASQIQENWLIATVVAAVALLTLIVFAAWSVRRRPKAAAAGPEEALDDDGDQLERIYHSYSVSDTQGRRIASAAKTGRNAGLGVATGPVVAWLERIETPQEMKFPIRSKSVRIGRHSTNDVVLSDSSVHRYHGVIVLNSNGKFELTDLGGANGCVVNGVRREKAELENGDVVAFGEVKLKFQSSVQ